VGSETTVAAASKACDIILERLEPVKAMVLKEHAEAHAAAQEAAAGEGSGGGGGAAAASEEVTDYVAPTPTFAELCSKAVGSLMDGWCPTVTPHTIFPPVLLHFLHRPGSTEDTFLIFSFFILRFLAPIFLFPLSKVVLPFCNPGRGPAPDRHIVAFSAACSPGAVARGSASEH
jgi:hypothetical protein